MKKLFTIMFALLFIFGCNIPDRSKEFIWTNEDEVEDIIWTYEDEPLEFIWSDEDQPIDSIWTEDNYINESLWTDNIENSPLEDIPDLDMPPIDIMIWDEEENQEPLINKIEENLYLDSQTNIWLNTVDWNSIQLTKLWWEKWICAGGWVLSYSNPLISDDSEYVLMTVNCGNETPEIFIKEIGSMRSIKIANWNMAEFKDWSNVIVVDSKDYKNILKDWTDSKNNLEISFDDLASIKTKLYQISQIPWKTIMYFQIDWEICADSEHETEMGICWNANKLRVFRYNDYQNLFYVYQKDDKIYYLSTDTKWEYIKLLFIWNHKWVNIDGLSYNLSVIENNEYISFDHYEEIDMCNKYVIEVASQKAIFDKDNFSCKDLIFLSSDQIWACTKSWSINVYSKNDWYQNSVSKYDTKWELNDCSFDKWEMLFSDSIKTKAYQEKEGTDIIRPIWRLSSTWGVGYEKVKYLGF